MGRAVTGAWRRGNGSARSFIPCVSRVRFPLQQAGVILVLLAVAEPVLLQEVQPERLVVLVADIAELVVPWLVSVADIVVLVVQRVPVGLEA